MKFVVKFVEGSGSRAHYLELSGRNLQALLDKLDDPLSMRMLIDGVRAVEDKEHYSERRPGVVYMPSTGEYS